MKSRFELLFVGLFVALGIATGGYFISQTLSKAKRNTSEVKGLAERRVEANLANFSIGFSLATKTREGISALYKRAASDQKRIVEVLKKAGFSDEEISEDVINYSFREFRDQNQNLVDQKHLLRGAVSVETTKVHDVAPARAALNALIAEGVNLENPAPTFRFTNLNHIKPEMLEEAAQSARAAAEQFAQNAGVKVGGIQSARQGSFVITDAGGGYENTRKIEKDVRVVTTISFYLSE